MAAPVDGVATRASSSLDLKRYAVGWPEGVDLERFSLGAEFTEDARAADGLRPSLAVFNVPAGLHQCRAEHSERILVLQAKGLARIEDVRQVGERLEKVAEERRQAPAGRHVVDLQFKVERPAGCRVLGLTACRDELTRRLAG